MNFEKYVKAVKDFPIKGVTFRDISPLLAAPEVFDEALIEMVNKVSEFDVVVAPDARGFVFGVPISLMTFKPFVMVRKAGKLPGEVVKQSYKLEYGEATLEMPKDALKPGQRVLIVDDVLATGGTIKAVKELVEKQGAVVTNAVFLAEITELKGAEYVGLEPGKIQSLIKY